MIGSFSSDGIFRSQYLWFRRKKKTLKKYLRVATPILFSKKVTCAFRIEPWSLQTKAATLTMLGTSSHSSLYFQSFKEFLEAPHAHNRWNNRALLGKTQWTMNGNKCLQSRLKEASLSMVQNAASLMWSLPETLSHWSLVPMCFTFTAKTLKNISKIHNDCSL